MPVNRWILQWLGRVGFVQISSILLVGFGSLVLVIFLIPLLFLSPQRNVALSAETMHAKVTFSGDSRWQLRGAVVCPLGDCSIKEQTTDLLRNDIHWQSCDTVTVQRIPALKGVLIIPSEDILDNSDDVIFLDDAAFEENGAQAFTGYLEIGEVASTGRSLLQNAEYEFYDQDPLAWLSSRSPDRIDSGNLRHGDSVLFVANANTNDVAKDINGQPCAEALANNNWRRHVVLGHISALLLPVRTGFTVTANSTTSDVALQITRQGLEQPLIIRPNWIDVVLASPSFFAISVILTYLGAVIQLFHPGSRKRAPMQESEN